MYQKQFTSVALNREYRRVPGSVYFFFRIAVFSPAERKAGMEKCLPLSAILQNLFCIIPFKDLLNYWHIFAITTHEPGQGAYSWNMIRNVSGEIN